MSTHESIEEASEILASADALVIVAGAGLTEAVGLPDISHDRALWDCFPHLEDIELGYRAIAQPRWFARDPTLAWGVFGRRLDQGRAANLSPVYDTLREWATSRDAFVFTTNVDGHFCKAGFDTERVYEVHGRLGVLQCGLPCGEHRWSAPPSPVVQVCEDTGRVDGEWPRCPECQRTARPNMILFDDWTYIDSGVAEQRGRYRRWLANLHMARLAVLEVGATDKLGTAKAQSGHLVDAGGRLIRLADGPASPAHDAVVVSGPVGDSIAAIRARMLS